MTKVNKDDFLRFHQQGAKRSGTGKAIQHHTPPRDPAPQGARRGAAVTVFQQARATLSGWRRLPHLLDEGAPVKEVAMTLGCTEATVNRHFPGRGYSSTVGRHARAVRTANIDLQLLETSHPSTPTGDTQS
jgi:hypothetical protein